jgi:hypothetical protein
MHVGLAVLVKLHKAAPLTDSFACTLVFVIHQSSKRLPSEILRLLSAFVLCRGKRPQVHASLVCGKC